MTLKEAKKAYKKEGIGIQYTASQMARADRFDEREEKRKKELERERQRLDNKRKRDEKEARERAVKQKMLEEGRITVEDTWGKVTASQPRLNKFFGQNAAAPSKRSIQEVVVDTKESSRNLQGAGGQTQDVIKTNKHESAATTIPDNVRRENTKNSHCPSAFEKENPSGNSSIASSNLCKTASQESKLRRDVRNLPSTLTELRPAQLNIPSAGSRKLVYDTKPWKAHNATPTISEIEDQEPEPRASKPNKAHIEDDTLIDKHIEPTDSGNDQGGSSTTAVTVSEHQGLAERPCRTTDEFDEEEDFTDGIDDETLLELYDDQDQKAATPIPALTDLASPSSTAILSSPSSDAEEGQPRTEKKEVQQTLPKSNSLSDSFTSCFNEIDEDDLIALAEEVEAEISTPSASANGSGETSVQLPQSTNCSVNPEKQTRQAAPSQPELAKSAPPSRSQHIETNLYSSRMVLATKTEDASRYNPKPSSPKREPQKTHTTMAPPPAPVHRHAKERNNTISSVSMDRPRSVSRAHPSLSKMRKERVLPWNEPSKQHYYTTPNNPSNDDFDVLGPSTQALMVELAEQAEAQISSSRK